MRAIALSGWLALLLFVASASAADKPAAPSATIVDVDGKPTTGILKSISPQELTLTGSPQQLSTEHLLRLTFTETKRTRPADGLVLLANGDRLFARATSIDQESLIVEWAALAPHATLRIPLEVVRGFLPNLAADSDRHDSLLAELTRLKPTSDVVLLRNGDRAGGELTAFSATSATLKAGDVESTIDRAAIRAILFNDELISFPPAEGLRVLLSFADGSHLTVRLVALAESGSLRATSLFGANLGIPVSSIVEMRFLGGRAVYLSDLQPAEYRFTPFLATEWPLRQDVAVSGTPLRLRGVEYPKGLGMHSRSEVVYRLDGHYRRFIALAGIDDTAGEMGSVMFQVDVDGKQVLSSPVQTIASDPLPIGPIDLAGKQRLTLRADFGPFGDVQDHADWCDAVLIQ